MKAGRELDALIAEKVMGFKFASPLEGGLAFTIDATYKLPSYSTDISAAWEVVEKIKRDHNKDKYGNDFYLRQYEDKWKAGFGTDLPFENFGEDADIFGIGDTAPHAICLAALEIFNYPIQD